MAWLQDRLTEKHSQAALAGAVIATATVASQPVAWSASGIPLWLGLSLVWAQSLVHVVLPDYDDGSSPKATPVVTSLSITPEKGN